MKLNCKLECLHIDAEDVCIGPWQHMFLLVNLVYLRHAVNLDCIQSHKICRLNYWSPQINNRIIAYFFSFFKNFQPNFTLPIVLK